jgi:hypothetical protein
MSQHAVPILTAGPVIGIAAGALTYPAGNHVADADLVGPAFGAAMPAPHRHRLGRSAGAARVVGAGRHQPISPALQPTVASDEPLEIKKAPAPTGDLPVPRGVRANRPSAWGSM